MPKSNLERIILIIGLIAIIVAAINLNISLMLSTTLIVLIALRRSEARYAAIAAYIAYVITGLSTSSVSIIGIVFWFYICLQMYRNWDTDSKQISFIALDSHMTGYYANMFLVLVLLNLGMYLIFSGFNFGAVLSIPVLYQVLTSSLQFLGIYLLAMRIREGALFYLGFLILRILLMITLIVTSGLIFGQLALVTLVLQAFLIFSFYKFNS